MEQTIERGLVLSAGERTDLRTILGVIGATNSMQDCQADEITITVPNDLSVYSEVFYCGRNEILRDFMSGVFDDDDKTPIGWGLKPGDRGTFERDDLVRLKDVCHDILQQIASTDPEEDDYVTYDPDHVKWLYDVVTAELETCEHKDIKYYYSFC